MRRSNLFIFFVFLFGFSSCDLLKKSKELAFNRYKITTPSMSPNFNVGETYAAFTSDTFQINQVVVYSPIKKLREENDKVVFLFRLVGKSGDYLEMKRGKLFLNGKTYPFILNLKHSYKVLTTAPLSDTFLQKFEEPLMSMDNEYQFFLTEDEVSAFKKNLMIREVISGIREPDETEYADGFPVIGKNKDNWGPIKIPRKGDHIIITEENLKQYQPIFSEHEGNKIPSVGDQITVSKDYYFVLGDNRHNALDSRYTGFIPQDRMKAYLVIN